MKDEDFMRLALEQASLSLSENEFPVGAVVVLNGKIIGRGRKLSSNFHMGHAEIHALQDALHGKRYKRDDDLVIYTTVEPCIMCYGAILNSPIKKVVYAFEDVYGGATSIDAKALPIRHHLRTPQIIKGVLRDESKELLKKFFLTTKDPMWGNKAGLLVKSVLE